MFLLVAGRVCFWRENIHSLWLQGDFGTLVQGRRYFRRFQFLQSAYAICFSEVPIYKDWLLNLIGFDLKLHFRANNILPNF